MHQHDNNDTVTSLSFKQVASLLKQNTMHDIHSLDDKKISNILLAGMLLNYQVTEQKKLMLFVTDGFCTLQLLLDSPKSLDYQVGCYYTFLCQIKQFKDTRFIACTLSQQILDSNILTRELAKIIFQAT
jgi:hypothetical protein